MNKLFVSLISFIMMFGITSCSDNSLLESESDQTLSEEHVDFTSESTKNTETSLSETSDKYSSEETENTSTAEDFDHITTSAADTFTSQEITDSSEVSKETETHFNPFLGDIDEYCGKEVSFACFYFIKRYLSTWWDDKEVFSVLYVFSDGTYRVDIYTNEDYFERYDCDGFSFDEINEPISVLSEKLELFDGDTIKNINDLIHQINFESEYIDYYPDYHNPNYSVPAVDPDYDVVDFYAKDKGGNLHRVSYDYVIPERFEESGFSLAIELDDEYAKEAVEVLKSLDAVKSWIKNNA